MMKAICCVYWPRMLSPVVKGGGGKNKRRLVEQETSNVITAWTGATIARRNLF